MPALALACAPGKTSSWTHCPDWSKISSVTCKDNHDTHLRFGLNDHSRVGHTNQSGPRSTQSPVIMIMILMTAMILKTAGHTAVKLKDQLGDKIETEERGWHLYWH